MPQIGDIKDANAIGLSKGCYQWCACVKCGRERYVRLEHNSPRSKWCRHCSQKESHPLYRGGHKIQKKNGYVYVGVYPNDFFFAMADRAGYIPEHRLVMAKALGRCLQRWEIVHHRGVRYSGIKNKSDNLQDNLQVVGNDRHNQITYLSTRIKYLEKRVGELEAQNEKR